MPTFDRKQHWENIYATRPLNTVSWYQPTPELSLNFVDFYKLPNEARIMDAGGGDSYFVDHLLQKGYQNITVLDISRKAIERAKFRLGDRADMVQWVEADVIDYQSSEAFDFWHDRAAFHFITEEKEIDRYINNLHTNLKPNGIAVIGTFSDRGPTKCSGIEIHQYSMKTLEERFKIFFKRDRCLEDLHDTPSGETQSFVFCSFTHT